MSADSTKIVVGVDGSPSSRAALRWAVRDAVLTGGMVEAVMAWQIPMILRTSAWAPIYVDEMSSFEEDARKTLDAVISNEVEPADSQRVTARVVYGHPDQVLLEAAADADLLVVGSRGHAGPGGQAQANATDEGGPRQVRQRSLWGHAYPKRSLSGIAAARGFTPPRDGVRRA